MEIVMDVRVTKHAGALTVKQNQTRNGHWERNSIIPKIIAVFVERSRKVRIRFPPFPLRIKTFKLILIGY